MRTQLKKLGSRSAVKFIVSSFKAVQMFTTFSNWFKDPLIQSLLLSPLMGVFFAAIFSGFERSPERNSPITVKEIVRIYRERIIHIERAARGTVNNDPLAIGMGIIMCLMFLAWKYVSYSETILSYLLILVFTTISFSVTTILISILKGHFNSASWWFYTIFPLILLMFCVYLLSLAWTAIDPKVIEAAQKATAIDFYIQELTEYGLYLVVTQLLGVLILFFLILLSTLIELHYLSLMNQRAQGIFNRLWVLIVQFTWRFSGKDTLVGSILLSLTAFLLLSGYVTDWVT